MRNYADDRIIPLLGPQTNRLGHEKAPGGTIARTTFEGKDLHLFAGGMRNALHFDWNADGEIFSFDSDMEPEFGVPWYRPVRVFWMPSGADLGYRGNSGKYPTWYEDSLPPLVEIGLGSPVGVTFGYRTAFPAKYQKALYVADNNYGQHHRGAPEAGPAAAMSRRRGRTSSGRSRSTARTPRMPHNVTDMIVSRDGTFYYVIGNRRTQSYLMKATYAGNQPTARVEYRNADGSQDRATAPRRSSSSTGRATIRRPSPPRGRISAARIGSCASPRASRSRPCQPSAWKARALAEQDAATAHHRDAGTGARRRPGGERRAVRGAGQVPALDALRSAAHPEAARHRGRRQPERQALGRRHPAGDRRRRRACFPAPRSS